MTTKNLIFFDTQVVSQLAGTAPAWRNLFWQHVTNQFSYRISPLTMFELFFGLANSHPAYFNSHKERFRVLMGNSKPRVLPLPEQFAVTRVLGIPIQSAFHRPRDCELYMKLVIRANSKEEIEAGHVRLNAGRRLAGLFLQQLLDIRAGFIEDHAALLNDVRCGRQAIPTARDWAKSLLYKLHLEPTNINADRFVYGVDAVYRYDQWLWNKANDTYDYGGKNGSDVIDSMQLFYLCDSRVHFLTGDKHIASRVVTSRQNGQILDYKHFSHDV